MYIYTHIKGGSERRGGGGGEREERKRDVVHASSLWANRS